MLRTLAVSWLWMASMCLGQSKLYGGSGQLYVSNGSHILRMYRQGVLYESVVHQPGGKIVGLAVDTDKELLFWSNTDVNVRSIWRARLNGSDVVEIVKDVEECNGLSIDWVSKHIYWTDAGKKTLEIANYNGSGRRILISSGLVNPRGIVVDPVSEYVFWADQSTRKIERSSLDGVDRKVIVDKDIIFPNQMAVSYPTRRLYWVDAKRQTIMSCDTDGGDVTKERDLIETSQGNPVFGLVVIGNTATISTWFHTKIVSTYVATRESLWSNEMVIGSSTELYSLAATTTAIQPQ
ncbi:low-density lipoprotein receptor-related protein 6, partial [Biomphalaria glabrata]